MNVLKNLGVDPSLYTLDELEAIARFYRTVYNDLRRVQPHWLGSDHYKVMVEALNKEVEKRRMNFISAAEYGNH